MISSLGLHCDYARVFLPQGGVSHHHQQPEQNPRERAKSLQEVVEDELPEVVEEVVEEEEGAEAQAEAEAEAECLRLLLVESFWCSFPQTHMKDRC